MKIKRTFATFIVVLLTSFLGVQISLNRSAIAAPGSADLSIAGATGYLGGVYYVVICNGGDETVTELTLQSNFTNYSPTDGFFLPPGNGSQTTTNAPATFDLNTGDWQGTLANGECIQIAFAGDITGSIGQQTQGTFSITQSTLSGSISNADPNGGNDSVVVGPTNIIDLPDLALETRLLTPGTISNGTTVQYEVNISNVGSGAVPTTSGEGLALAFIVPTEASFSSVVDDDTNDNLNISLNPGCFPLGPPSNAGSGLSGYSGIIVVCILEATQDLQPGESFPFIFNMTANSGFASGATTVYGFISGSDEDSLRNQVGLLRGEDTFSLLQNMNNLVTLQYDPSPLTVTINRCQGQGATTTNGTGCFTVSFNKLIYAPNFTQSDLVLTGGGTVTGFTQLDDFTWRVDISGIQPGTTLALTLGPASVEDYSAVTNGVSVLGENTIRFEANGTAISTLPETGFRSSELLTSLIMIILGLGLANPPRRKTGVGLAGLEPATERL